MKNKLVKSILSGSILIIACSFSIFSFSGTYNSSFHIIRETKFSSFDYCGDILNYSMKDESSSRWEVVEKDGDNRLFLNTTAYQNDSGLRVGEFAILKDRVYSDFSFNLDVKTAEDIKQNPGADYAVIFGWQDINNYYYLMANAHQPWSQLFVVKEGVRYELNNIDVNSNNDGYDTSLTPLIPDENWHNLTLTRGDKVIKIILDGVVKLQVHDDNTFSNGCIGVGSYNDSVYFDNIKVSAYEQFTREKPYLYLNENEITDIRNKIKLNKQPWKETYEYIKKYIANPNPDATADIYHGVDSKEYRKKFTDTDSQITHANAIVYVIENNLNYALKVKEFLLDWANASMHEIDPSTCFDIQNIGIGFVDMSAAYALVYNAPIFTEAERTIIENWFRLGYKLIKEGDKEWKPCLIKNNHSLCHVASNHVTQHISALVTLGFLLGDRTLAMDAIEGLTVPKNFITLLTESIYMDNDPSVGCEEELNPTFGGEIVDRYRHYDINKPPYNDPSADPNDWHNEYRGFGYSLVSLNHMSNTAEVAYHNGMDYFNYCTQTGENIKLPAIYYSYFPHKFIKPSNDPGEFRYQRNLIEKTIYPGSSHYRYELIVASYGNIFEILSLRYFNHKEIIRAFDNYKPDQRLFPRGALTHFGKYYNHEELVWNFHLDNLMEGWTFRANGDVNNVVIENSQLSFTCVGGDPIMDMNGLAVDTSGYNTFSIRIKANSDSVVDTVVQLFWYNEGDTAISYERAIGFNILADNQFHTITIDLTNHPGWHKNISRLRLDPSNKMNVTISIDYIRFSETEIQQLADWPATISPASFDFGNIDPNCTSMHTYTMTNVTDSDLNVGNISITGSNASEFILQNDNCSDSILEPSAQCIFELVFEPASLGEKEATLRVSFNTPDTKTIEVLLKGKAPEVCEGDFDNDGDVDGSDLSIFAADFERTDCDKPDGLPCEGDFDKDGDVDGSDLALFAADFGRTDCPYCP